MRLLLSAGWLAVLLAWPAAAGAAAPPDIPPYRRVLAEADARRVAQLQAEVRRLRAAGRFADAQGPARQVVALRGRALGDGHWQTADARRTLATLERLAGLPVAERAELAEARQLSAEAQRFLRAGRADRAEALQRRVVAAYRKAYGDKHSVTATGYHNLAFCLQQQGKYDQAEPLLRQALAISLDVLGEEHPDTASSFAALAVNFLTQGKHAQALPAARQALAIRLRVRGEDHPDTAASYNDLAGCLEQMGRHAQAEPLFRKALRLRRRLLGEGSPETAMTSSNLGLNLHAQGKYAQAGPPLARAVAILRARAGEGHPDTATAYNNFALNLHSQGKYAQAEPLFLRALEVRRRALGERHPDLAASYLSVAANLDAQGKHREAEPLFRKALNLFRKVLGEGHPRTATACDNLASNLDAQEKFDAAQALHRQALAIQRKVLGEDHPDTATSYNNLAFTLGKLGQHDQAEGLLQKALAIQRRTVGEDHPATAAACNNLAHVHKAQGKLEAALGLHRQALAIQRRVLGDDHPDTGRGHHNLASTLHALGRHAEAEKHARQAVRIFEAARLLVSQTGLGRGAVADLRSPLPLMAALLARNGKPAEAWQVREASLARALLDEMAQRNRRLLPAERDRLASLRAELARIDRLLPALLADRSAEAREQARLLRERRPAAQQALAQWQADLEKKYGPAAGQVYPLAAIQKHLGEREALLGWVDLRTECWACLVRSRGEPLWVRLSGSGPGGAWTDADHQRSVRLRRALARPSGGDWQELARALYRQRLAPLEAPLRRAGVRHLIVLPGVSLGGIPLEVLQAVGPGPAAFTVSHAPSGTLYAHLRQRAGRAEGAPALLALGDPAFRRPEAPEKGPDPPDHGLFVTRAQPGGAADRAGLRPGDVLLSFDGARLTGVSDLQAALRKRAGGPGKGPDVEATVWRRGKTTTVKLASTSLGLAVDRRSPATVLRAEREARRMLAEARAGFAPLPGTRREVTALAGLFARAEALLGESASERGLEELRRKGSLKGYRYLHLATHGLIDTERPLASFLALADRDLPDPLKSVLAGSAAPTGRLTAGHVLESWELGAELVVLSACQTGLGKYERGEGFVGFAQAFLLAGARSLVLSQWSVDDEATALLMVRFYQNLLGKRDGLKGPMPKAEALQEARDWLRKLSAKEVRAEVARLPRGKAEKPVPLRKEARPFAHPYYWAAFVLVGGPR
jgi:CHAT domain-containing protein/tetratricopeptide (TPR) repeat protein